MQQFCTYGSVRGALGNRCPYRDNRVPRIRQCFSDEIVGTACAGDEGRCAASAPVIGPGKTLK